MLSVHAELPHPEIPRAPNHEVVGVVERLGDGVSNLAVGDRVGVPWLGYSCGECRYCKNGRENLCASARHIVPGGGGVCAGVHMSDISSFAYRLLWEERVVRSVANLTRQDEREFLALAPKVPVKTHVQLYDLADTNRALADLREGRFQCAAVVKI